MISSDLLKQCLITVAAAAATSAGTAVTGAVQDMQGFDGVIFCVKIATVNAGNYLKAQQGQQSGGGDQADLAGTKVVGLVDANLLILDVYKPLERYVRPVLIRGGANTVSGEIIAIRYRAHKQPTVNTVANASDAVTVISPAEGTP